MNKGQWNRAYPQELCVANVIWYQASVLQAEKHLISFRIQCENFWLYYLSKMSLNCVWENWLAFYVSDCAWY